MDRFKKTKHELPYVSAKHSLENRIYDSNMYLFLERNRPTSRAGRCHVPFLSITKGHDFTHNDFTVNSEKIT